MNKIGNNELKLFESVKGGGVTSPKGFHAGGLHCGLKRKRKDLGWIYSDVPAAAAAVYTMNAYQAAPLKVTQESIKANKKLQGVIVNSANANACTGKQGLEDAYEMRHLFAHKMGIKEHLAAVVSTGIIGERLPLAKIEAGIDRIHDPQHQVSDYFEEAILTTDTCTKKIAVHLQIDGKDVTIGGAAKGSGMIHPNMATMLAFITTDALIEQDHLQGILREVTNETFNMITVDGDTSTNDMVLVLANGKAGNEALTPQHVDWQIFEAAVKYVCTYLAKQIARDGEGATKLIEVQVQGAANEQIAKQMSKSIIGSNLVKTAIFGEDPNWGRIVCAVGYSEQPFNPDKLSVCIGPIQVVREGLPVPFDEEEAKTYLAEENILITVDLNEGMEQATAWGCDLSYDYVKINALYRT